MKDYSKTEMMMMIIIPDPWLINKKERSCHLVSFMVPANHSEKWKQVKKNIQIIGSW